MSSPFGGEGAAWGGRPRARAVVARALEKNILREALARLGEAPGFLPRSSSAPFRDRQPDPCHRRLCNE